jgi:hypothetical protein
MDNECFKTMFLQGVFMLLSRNPPPKGLANIISKSSFKAAKWIKEAKTGDTWYWPAEQETHAGVASIVGATEYSKGIAVME